MFCEDVLEIGGEKEEELLVGEVERFVLLCGLNVLYDRRVSERLVRH